MCHCLPYPCWATVWWTACLEPIWWSLMASEALSWLLIKNFPGEGVCPQTSLESCVLRPQPTARHLYTYAPISTLCSPHTLLQSLDLPLCSMIVNLLLYIDLPSSPQAKCKHCCKDLAPCDVLVFTFFLLVMYGFALCSKMEIWITVMLETNAA